MEYKNLLIGCEAGICTITVNRPEKLNALNKETLAEINDAVVAAENDDGVHGIIITGAGTKAFVAGADIVEFRGLSMEYGKALAANGHKVMNRIEKCTKPVIAAVNGYALGGGCELAMACHLRIASENARFGQPEANLGLIPGYGGTQRLAQYIGKGKALELLMTTDTLAANQALQSGLVNAVVKPEELLEKCKSTLEKIATKGPLAIAAIIRCVNAGHSGDINGFDTEIDEFGKCFGTADFNEGISAFLEKRKAGFTGK